MSDIIVTPDDLDPKDENINKENLQNNSDQSNQPTDSNSNATGRKHYRGDNKMISNLKTVKKQKENKVARLTRERDKQKDDLNRGYIIVPLDDQRSKHVKIDTTDKSIIASSIAEKEFEIYELGLDIEEIKMKIQDLATAKKSNFKGKLSKKKQSIKDDKTLKQINGKLTEALNNGSKSVINNIQEQYNSGNKIDAYYSLKEFLSQELKSVAKQLNKSPEREKEMLDRVLDKLSKAELL